MAGFRDLLALTLRWLSSATEGEEIGVDGYVVRASAVNIACARTHEIAVARSRSGQVAVAGLVIGEVR